MFSNHRLFKHFVYFLIEKSKKYKCLDKVLIGLDIIHKNKCSNDALWKLFYTRYGNNSGISLLKRLLKQKCGIRIVQNAISEKSNVWIYKPPNAEIKQGGSSNVEFIEYFISNSAVTEYDLLSYINFIQNSKCFKKINSSLKILDKWQTDNNDLLEAYKGDPDFDDEEYWLSYKCTTLYLLLKHNTKNKTKSITIPEVLIKEFINAYEFKIEIAQSKEKSYNVNNLKDMKQYLDNYKYSKFTFCDIKRNITKHVERLTNILSCNQNKIYVHNLTVFRGHHHDSFYQSLLSNNIGSNTFSFHVPVFMSTTISQNTLGKFTPPEGIVWKIKYTGPLLYVDSNFKDLQDIGEYEILLPPCKLEYLNTRYAWEFGFYRFMYNTNTRNWDWSKQPEKRHTTVFEFQCVMV